MNILISLKIIFNSSFLFFKLYTRRYRRPFFEEEESPNFKIDASILSVILGIYRGSVLVEISIQNGTQS